MHFMLVMQGGPVEYVKQDDNSRKWMNEFRSKSYAKPISFEAVEGLLMFKQSLSYVSMHQFSFHSQT